MDVKNNTIQLSEILKKVIEETKILKEYWSFCNFRLTDTSTLFSSELEINVPLSFFKLNMAKVSDKSYKITSIPLTLYPEDLELKDLMYLDVELFKGISIKKNLYSFLLKLVLLESIVIVDVDQFENSWF